METLSPGKARSKEPSREHLLDELNELEYWLDDLRKAVEQMPLPPGKAREAGWELDHINRVLIRLSDLIDPPRAG